MNQSPNVAAIESDPRYDLTEYNHHIESVKFHEGKKSEHIKRAIEELIIQSYPKEKISSKLKNDLAGYASPDYIQEICAATGVTDQRYTRSDYIEEREELLPVEGQVINDNGDGTITVMKGGVPEVGKTPPTISSTPPKPINPYPRENAEYISFIDEVIDVAKTVKDRLESEPFQSQANNVEEHIYYGRAALDMIRQMWDKRRTILKGSQSYLTQLTLTTTIAHAAGEFQNKLKDMGELTSKQATKTLKGIVADVDYIYEPSSKLEAQLNGFIGVPCEKCGNWRVKPDGDMAFCFKCEHTFDYEREKLGYTQLQEQDRAESEAA